jgi:hypothetical protein
MRKTILVSLFLFSANFLFAESSKHYLSLGQGKVIMVEIEKSPSKVFWGACPPKIKVKELTDFVSSDKCFGIERMLRYTFLSPEGKPLRGNVEENLVLLDQNFLPELPLTKVLRKQQLDKRGQVADLLIFIVEGEPLQEIVWRDVLQTLYFDGVPVVVNRIRQQLGPRPEDCVIEIKHESLNAEYSYAR